MSCLASYSRMARSISVCFCCSWDSQWVYVMLSKQAGPHRVQAPPTRGRPSSVSCGERGADHASGKTDEDHSPLVDMLAE